MTTRSLISGVVAAVIGGAVGLGAIAVAVPRRAPATPSLVARDDRLLASFEVLLENRSAVARTYTVTLADGGDAILKSRQARWRVEAQRSKAVPVLVELPRESHTHTIYVRIDDDRGLQRVTSVVLGDLR
ncbi:MAG TPA: FixG Ig-like domain-containing protein [Kofleriaceae bacterium]